MLMTACVFTAVEQLVTTRDVNG